MKFLCKRFTPVAVVVALLTISASARAGTLEIMISDGGLHPNLIIVDNGVGDTNPAVNQITVSQAVLNKAFPEIRGSGTIIAAFSTTTDNSSSSLTVNANVTSLPTNIFPGSTPAVLTINASETGFSAPSANPKLASTNATFSFKNELPGSLATFQGGVDTTDTLFGQNTPAGLLSAIAPGPGSGSSSTVFSSGAYAITNIETLDLQPGGTIVDNGSTTVTATPEPSTLVLACLAGVPFAIARFQRWGRKNAAQKPFAV